MTGDLKKNNISIGNTWSLHSPMDHDRCNFMHLLLKNHAFPSRCGQSSAIVTPIRWKSEGPALPLTDDAPPGQSQHRSLKLENPSAFPREVLSSQLVCDPFPCPLAFWRKKPNGQLLHSLEATPVTPVPLDVTPFSD